MINLRLYIRKVILEGMVAPSAISDSHAILSDYYPDAGEAEAGEEINFLMYDIEKAKTEIEKEINFILEDNDPDMYDPNDEVELAELLADYSMDIASTAISNSIVAAIRARVPDAGHGECNGAWEIIRSAAIQGFGPTLYDMIMSISPQGLTSDRSSVSNDAKNVWNKYANQRDDVDKAFLDPMDLTTWEADDCTTQGGNTSNSSLWNLTRVMAVEYFRSEWPLEYETMENEIDMAQLQDWGTMSGDEYYANVSMWIEDHADLPEMEEWDIDEANDGWYEWKSENELQLIDQKEGDFESPEFLNLSYNTDYASSSFEDLQSNHWNFRQYMEEKSLDLEQIDEVENEISMLVRDFFQEHY